MGKGETFDDGFFLAAEVPFVRSSGEVRIGHGQKADLNYITMFFVVIGGSGLYRGWHRGWHEPVIFVVCAVGLLLDRQTDRE